MSAGRWGVAALTAALTVATFQVQPLVPARLQAHPWGYVFPSLAIGGLLVMRIPGRRHADRDRFLASCAYLAGMMASAAFGLYPYVLPSIGDPSLGLTVHNAAASGYGLRVGLAWWIPGILLASAYFVLVYRRFAGKVRAEGEGGTYWAALAGSQGRHESNHLTRVSRVMYKASHFS